MNECSICSRSRTGALLDGDVVGETGNENSRDRVRIQRRSGRRHRIHARFDGRVIELAGCYSRNVR